MIDILLIILLFAESYHTVDKQYDIRQYYDKPYCEEQKVGNTTVKKCYKVVEVN